MKRSIFCTMFSLLLAACDGSSNYSSAGGASSDQGAIVSSVTSESSSESASSSQAQARCSDDLAETNRTVARDALEQFFIQKDMSAIDRFWKDPYIQHNPIAQSGVENFRNVFQSFLGSVEYGSREATIRQFSYDLHGRSKRKRPLQPRNVGIQASKRDGMAGVQLSGI